MIIKNNKLIFEVVECWKCKGKGEVENYSPCPNDNKKTYGKPCQYCGSKNRYSHKYSEKAHLIPCGICKGKGKRLENRFDNITPKIMDYLLDNLKFIWKGNYIPNVNLDYKLIADLYLGKNAFAGCQDYIDHRKDKPEELLKIIKKDAKTRLLQALNYIVAKDNTTLIEKIVFYGYNGGYTADFIK